MKEAICLAGHFQGVPDTAHLSGSFCRETCRKCGGFLYSTLSEKLNADWVSESFLRFIFNGPPVSQRDFLAA